MSKKLDKFFDDLSSFFDVPSDPPPRPILPNWFDKRTVDHGKLLQYRETHQFNAIRVEKMYEDGYHDMTISLDRARYVDKMVIVDGIEYPNSADYGNELGPDSCQKSDPGVATTKTNNAIGSDRGNRTKLDRKNQAESDNLYPPNDLHPYLVGDYLIVEAEYQWPKLPQYNAYDPGEQMGLFGNIEGKTENVRRAKKRSNDRKSRGNADPLTGFFSGLDSD